MQDADEGGTVPRYENIEKDFPPSRGEGAGQPREP